MYGRIILLQLIISASIQLELVNTLSPNDNHHKFKLVDRNVFELFNCQITMAQKPEVHKVQLDAYNLIFDQQAKRRNLTNLNIIELENSKNRPIVSFEKINFRESWRHLRLSTLDSSLPFTFFINGFNHPGGISGSWLEGPSKVFTNYGLNQLNSSSNYHQKSNIVFLPWQLTNIHPTNPVSLTVAYYTTMASYSTVMEDISKLLLNIIDFIEETEGGGLWSHKDGNQSSTNSNKNYQLIRAKHYRKFKFYAHSLGSHLISNAIDLVHQSRPWVKFGTMVGLDPALPCFLDDNHGLSAFRLINIVDQVRIIHSNAAFSGIYTDRGHINIVLNGGTFQPKCDWLDFSCSHTRATDIFNYLDDECQMVAYKCNKYEQFKLGACEICDSFKNGSDLQHVSNWPNCVLVNLDEQHPSDSGILLPPNSVNGNYHPSLNMRKLANDSDDDIMDSDNSNQFTWSTLDQMESMLTNAKGYGYHYVNTNTNYMITNTHCLQHYQLRLLTLSEDSTLQVKCPLGSFALDDSKDIKVKLIYEEMKQQNILERNQMRYFVPDSQAEESRRRNGLANQALTPIVDDKLYTGLLTFSGKAELFVGAIIESIDLKDLSNCLIENDVAGDINFTLDIAFMSNTKSSVRHAYSSILCGKWNPYHIINHDEDIDEALVLTLCKQSELINVSGQIDDILEQIKFHHQYEPWKVALLNSLFYLYSKWEPLRHE